MEKMSKKRKGETTIPQPRRSSHIVLAMNGIKVNNFVVGVMWLFFGSKKSMKDKFNQNNCQNVVIN